MESYPFRHCVIDGFVTPELCRAAIVEWPGETWPHWFRYEGREGKKYASKDALRLPVACQEILSLMMRLPISELIGVSGTFPDTTLYGAGMHMIPPGGSLPRHLDSDHHPVTGWGRAVSCVLWVDDWQNNWGGRLRFWDGDQPVVAIAPKPGRLAIFECCGLAWHDVEPVNVSADNPRRSLSAFYWTEKAEHKDRSRAEFTPARVPSCAVSPKPIN